MAASLINSLTSAAFFLAEGRFLSSPPDRIVILVGLLSGFMTFSSYGLQTFVLLRDVELDWLF